MQPLTVRLGALCSSQRRRPAACTHGVARQAATAALTSCVCVPTHARRRMCAPTASSQVCVTTRCCAVRFLRLVWRCAARICPVSEPWCTTQLEPRAAPGNAPDPNVAPASARWLAATLPAAYVPPTLLVDLLEASLTQEAERCVCAALCRLQGGGSLTHAVAVTHSAATAWRCCGSAPTQLARRQLWLFAPPAVTAQVCQRCWFTNALVATLRCTSSRSCRSARSRFGRWSCRQVRPAFVRTLLCALRLTTSAQARLPL